MTLARRGAARLLVVPVLGLLLAACSVTTSDKPAVSGFNPIDPGPSASTVSGTAAPVGPDLQLRPVLSVVRAGTDECPASPEPTTPPADQPATLCSADLTTVVGLGPAVVSGPHVKAIDSGTLTGGPTVRITLDVSGATALSNATAEMATKSAPGNLLAVVTHGRVQTAPQIGDQITGGVFDLTGFATLDDARAAAALFGG